MFVIDLRCESACPGCARVDFLPIAGRVMPEIVESRITLDNQWVKRDSSFKERRKSEKENNNKSNKKIGWRRKKKEKKKTRPRI